MSKVKKGDLCAIQYTESYHHLVTGQKQSTFFGLRIVSKTVREKFLKDGEEITIPQVSHCVDIGTWKRREEGRGVIVNAGTDIDNFTDQVWLLPDWVQDYKLMLYEFCCHDYRFDNHKILQQFVLTMVKG